jgi:hypothetical protein
MRQCHNEFGHTPMPDPLLPRAVPRATAAVLAGRSPRAFRSFVIRPGLVETDDRGWVLLASLERFLGKTITAEVLLTADRKRDRARSYQQDYRDTRKTGAIDVLV